jgi:hypothetical protein
MKKFIKTIFLIFGLIFLGSCDLDLLDNPNAVTSSNTDINYLLNAIELNLRGHFN